VLIGVPREIKDKEFRAGMVPASVHELVKHGHQVLVQSGLGNGIGVSDADYQLAGASVAIDAAEIFERAELIVKVKEPQSQEIPLLRKGQLLFTYLHLAPDREQTLGLLERGVTAIAYETVVGKDGGLPLLAPMSEVAGRLAVQAGAYCLERKNGGAGILLGGVTGVEAGKVVIIGGGTVIGAVLIPGAAAPKLLSAAQIKRLRPGTVLVDVAIDQGGCFETSRPTTHSNPTYMVDGIVHYCVANMPGAVPRTSSFALNNATLPYIVKLADMGWRRALRTDPGFLKGLNAHEGHLSIEAVAKAHQLEYTPAEQLIELR
jgi:alanine dehydrogenase